MSKPLAGHRVLVLEDEVLIAFEVVHSLEMAGATVLKTAAAAEALRLLDTTPITAAVLDHGLKEGDSSDVCTKLKELNIPFVIYSGYSHVGGDCALGEHISKPADPQLVVTTLQGALAHPPARHA